MPLPQFLLMLAAVVVAAMATIVGAIALGLPLPVLAMAALILGLVVRMSMRQHDAPRLQPRLQPVRRLD